MYRIDFRAVKGEIAQGNYCAPALVLLQHLICYPCHADAYDNDRRSPGERSSWRSGMGSFGQGWALATASWRILRADAEMTVFVLLAGLCTLVATAMFILPLLFAFGREGEAPAAVWVGVLFAFYLVLSLIATFFNTALVGAALERLRGGNAPTLRTGFQVARENLPAIAVYALISATVVTLLRLLAERFELIGQIVAALLGGLWSVVGFLVIPVYVAEGVNPFTAIKRSTALLRRTWGAQITGGASIGLVFILLSLLAAVPVLLGFLSGSLPLLIVSVVLAALYLGALFLIRSALEQVFRAALYIYAETGTVAGGFESWMMKDAFRPKKATG
jgi:Family of unknown function (DUF6159)